MNTGSPSGYITITELKHWFKWALVFTLPADLAFLITLQTGGDFRIAIGAAYSALLSALIGLTKTYMASNNNPTNNI